MSDEHDRDAILSRRRRLIQSALLSVTLAAPGLACESEPEVCLSVAVDTVDDADATDGDVAEDSAEDSTTDVAPDSAPEVCLSRPIDTVDDGDAPADASDTSDTSG